MEDPGRLGQLSLPPPPFLRVSALVKVGPEAASLQAEVFAVQVASVVLPLDAPGTNEGVVAPVHVGEAQSSGKNLGRSHTQDESGVPRSVSLCCSALWRVGLCLACSSRPHVWGGSPGPELGKCGGSPASLPSVSSRRDFTLAFSKSNDESSGGTCLAQLPKSQCKCWRRARSLPAVVPPHGQAWRSEAHALPAGGR